MSLEYEIRLTGEPEPCVFEVRKHGFHALLDLGLLGIRLSRDPMRGRSNLRLLRVNNCTAYQSQRRDGDQKLMQASGESV